MKRGGEFLNQPHRQKKGFGGGGSSRNEVNNADRQTSSLQVSSDHHQSENSAGSSLPPGFRFHPTDDELVSYYLINKVANPWCIQTAIGEVDFNKVEPWDLPEKASMDQGEGVLYFFTLRDRKYPTGLRTNRATEKGYWKATGKDRPVTSSKSGRLVGMKKTLVFYKGRAPKGMKTSWIMHEYRLDNGESTTTPDDAEEWVVCRIFEKSSPSKGMTAESNQNTRYNSINESEQQPSASLPPLQNLEPQSPNSENPDSLEMMSMQMGDHSMDNFANLWEFLGHGSC